MLFKKYGRWGGVIEENYRSFITNMSGLIEDDLVNGRTLAPEFNGEGFRRAVQKWVEDIFSRELPQNSGDAPLKAIADIETSAGLLAGLLEDAGGGLTRSLFAEAGTFNVESVLSKKQYDYIAERIANAVMSDTDKHKAAIRQALSAFLDGNSIGSLISEDAIRKLAGNVAEIVRKTDFSELFGCFDTAFDGLLADPGIDGLVTEFLRQSEPLRLIDIVKDGAEFSRALPDRIAAFASSEKGQAALREMCGKLLSAASRLDIKLIRLASRSVKDGIARFCRDEMPRVIDSIIGFVLSKRREIEEIVNHTVDNELEKTSGGRGGKFLKDFFIENLATRIDVVEKIVESAQKYKLTAGADVSGRIIAFMKTKTVGEIVTTMRDAGILSEESIAGLACFNIKELSGDVSKFIIDFLEKPLRDSPGGIDISVVKTMLLPKLFNHIKTSLFTDKFKEHICTVIAAKMTELPDKCAADLFNVNDIPINFDKQRITNRLAAFWKTVARMKIGDVAGENPPEYMRIKKDSLLKIWDSNKSQKLDRLYGAVRGDSVYAGLSEWLIGVINENTGTVLTGHVSASVEAELDKLRPKEINGVVQGFIGKEMKAINILGAVLGAVAGLLPPLAGLLFNIPNTVTLWMTAVYGIIFTLVGVGTNWLAIRMLFRPYKPLFDKIKFPPFVGIVAARKPQFAKDTARFIKNKMLAEQSLKHRFTNSKAAIKRALRQSVSASDYAVIDTVFKDPKRLDSITVAAFNGVKKYILEHRAGISAMLAGKLKQLADNHELDRIVSELQRTITNKLRTGNIAAVIYEAIKTRITGKTLDSCGAAAFFSDARLETLLKNIIPALAENITADKLKNFIDSRNDRFVSYIASHSIVDFAGTDVVNGLLNKIDGLTDAILQNAARTVIKHLEKQLDPTVKLRNLYNGMIPYLLEKNNVYITDALCGEIKKSKGAIVREIQDGLPFYALPWRGHVDSIVDALIDNELPAFFNRNRHSLTVITGALLDNPLANIGFSPLENVSVGQAVEAFLQRLRQDTAESAADAVRRFTRLPLSRILGLANIRQTGDIALEPFLAAAVSVLKNNLSREETVRAAAKQAAVLIKTIPPGILKTIPIADLLKDIDIEKETGHLVSRILNDRNVTEAVYDGIGSILFTAIKDASFYDEAELRNDISGFIAFAVQDNRLEAAVTPYFREFFTKLNGAVTNETKNCIAGHLADAMVDACEHNFDRIFESVDVARVVEREINNMHPREIETLFNKFAGGYFTKIIFYGWIGLFGGLLGYFIICLFN
jgi:uncharacterized membrane protein YheB (UPF0754 family)